MNNFHAACGLSWLLCVWRLWHSFWDIICSYHQGRRAAPCLVSSFSNQSGCISSLPRCGRLFFFGGTADAASEANSTHFTYTKNIFLPPLLHAQLISDVACRWLLNSSALCFPPPPSHTSLCSSKYKLEICASEKEREMKGGRLKTSLVLLLLGLIQNVVLNFKLRLTLFSRCHQIKSHSDTLVRRSRFSINVKVSRWQTSLHQVESGL